MAWLNTAVDHTCRSCRRESPGLLLQCPRELDFRGQQSLRGVDRTSNSIPRSEPQSDALQLKPLRVLQYHGERRGGTIVQDYANILRLNANKMSLSCSVSIITHFDWLRGKEYRGSLPTRYRKSRVQRMPDSDILR